MKTKNDRRKVYLMAAEMMTKRRLKPYVCCVISKILWKNDFCTTDAEEESEELRLFKPKDYRDYYSHGWFGEPTKESRGSRIIALLLCAEMCRK